MIKGFEEYLGRKDLVHDKYISYYVNWVSSCYSYLNQPDDCLLATDQVQDFLKHISRTRADWQVKQAEAAIRSYIWLALSRKAQRIKQSPYSPFTTRSIPSLISLTLKLTSRPSFIPDSRR